ncbi:hypothetical protein AJ78_07488 [Emergomyces pasteurianus Ep9510]|uniref:Uncharacterized protein n=1 Tax=Emergomyces pasteurianus Ep9510 TaxID=1447872 RepID=A0A1J9Q7B5_9EURO|nr:hypothetical protein AJ78_07488 [Emergomyces pasteurianus Ep9510]
MSGPIALARINSNIAQLLQRFENIMATATVDNPNFTSTAIETYQLDVESTALVRTLRAFSPSLPSLKVLCNLHIGKPQMLNAHKANRSLVQIRAAEDILSLTRTMKEAWLFGKLDILGEDEMDVRRREGLERDAQTVKNAIENGTLLKME